MKRFLRVAVGCLVLAGVLLAPIAPVQAIEVLQQCDTAALKDSPVCKGHAAEDAQGKAKQVVEAGLLVLGTLCIIMILFGGIRYAKSAADATKIKAAKDTITYAVAGLIVALLSFSIVRFVLDQF